MEFYPLELISDMMQAQGVNFHQLCEDLTDLSLFDCNLRQQLFTNYDYSDIRAQLLTHCRPKTLYLIKDKFELNYIIFKYDKKASEESSSYIFLGPYLVRQASEFLHQVVEENNLHAFHLSAMRDYYNGIPLVLESKVLESEVALLVKYVFDTNDFEINRSSLNFDHDHGLVEIQSEPNLKLSMIMIEERYKSVDILLDAVTRGDYKAASLQMDSFRKYSIENRHSDMLRNYKNLMIVLNSQLRRAVQDADVHPAHIHHLSGYFSRKIEAARNSDEMYQFVSEMIRDYCRLVHNHSLKKYSKNIQRVINHIEFNLDEPFVLKNLAEIAGVNANYLSTCFRRETNVNLSDYINQKRVQRAVFLLNSTELPIHVIAERVGIMDENYFSRLFKKIQGKSPREYRKSLT